MELNTAVVFIKIKYRHMVLWGDFALCLYAAEK